MLPIMHLILNLKKPVLSEHGEKFTLEQCHTININLGKIGKSQNFLNHATFKNTKLKNLGIDLAPQIIDKS